ncbi:MAG TPA: hypothetical protein VMY35_10435 [Phycisphaerae bacterium]|nr:hypothetical protein [Phycisphaerae bacterium]
MTKQKRPKTYEAKVNGRSVQVTVPPREAVAYSGDLTEVLRDVIRDNLSPHAVAAVVSCLRINRTNNPQVDGQVHWFAEELVKMLGGPEEQVRLGEELGL